MAERSAPVLHAKGPADVIALATRAYLDGEPVDMSALAHQLGIGRATLYRWVGNREELLAVVLAEATERTFRAAERSAQNGAAGGGPEYVVDVLAKFMRSVLAAPGLKALTQREPMVFIRLATTPGAIEDRAAALVEELLERERAAGRLPLLLPVPPLAVAIVRVCDFHMYAHLLGRGAPEVETALQIVRVLVGAHTDGTGSAAS
ncbi:QsdR family transcriptional regulator [Cryptosporangium aurantiacum]|uniref:Transcriptional regulator, TetR family n=1 Tax=Cryptosporangium aurantiacum TaxID=134849 RepID=A0A1M7H176_9ACTN|nr:QsdR family transcriptional regulator [Cryptosporangium aurantiacum]SHM22113.1 transcriptional regulator, TetR family [Cryptosporangium aurantiacum]